MSDSFKIDRRAVLCAPALLAACGKLAERSAFLVPDAARDQLVAALEAFALQQRFKFSYDPNVFDRPFFLSSDDIDISFAPREPRPLEGAAEEPAPVDAPESSPPTEPAPVEPPPPRVSPVRYEAWFYTLNEIVPRLNSVVGAFNRAVAEVDGVRKVGLEAHA